MSNFAAQPQAAFGRRSQQRASSAPRGGAPDLAAAQDALRRGKLPNWTQQTRGALLFAAASFAAMFLAMAAIYGPGLARDLRLAGTWRPALDLRAEDGRCTNYQFVWTDCRVVVISPGPQGEQRETLSYMMSFTRGGGELLIPMRSTRDPEAVAISYSAQDELANRSITFAVYSLLLGGGLVVLALRISRGQYKGGRAHQALAAGLTQLAGAAA